MNINQDYRIVRTYMPTDPTGRALYFSLVNSIRLLKQSMMTTLCRLSNYTG